MANAISLDSLDSLDSQVKNNQEQLTNVQFDNYLLNLKGTKVNWRGKVLDVTKESGYDRVKNEYLQIKDVKITN